MYFMLENYMIRKTIGSETGSMFGKQQMLVGETTDGSTRNPPQQQRWSIRGELVEPV
jgi:hypothetical protein